MESAPARGSAWGKRMSPCPKGETEAGSGPAKINDLGMERIRFRFVLIQKLTRKKSCGRFEHCLWMESGCRCADSANHITSSRLALIATSQIIGKCSSLRRE